MRTAVADQGPPPPGARWIIQRDGGELLADAYGNVCMWTRREYAERALAREPEWLRRTATIRCCVVSRGRRKPT